MPSSLLTSTPLATPLTATTLLDGTPGATPAQRASAALPLAELVGGGEVVPVVSGQRVRYVNLDYAASAPALRPVADLVGQVLPLYASVHRGAGYASQACTAAYEAARRDVAAFVGAGGDDVTVFTRNTTDALNLLARAVPGPVVYLDIEHHANLLPWRRPDRGARPAHLRRDAGGAGSGAGGNACRAGRGNRRVERHRGVPAAGPARRRSRTGTAPG